MKTIRTREDEQEEESMKAKGLNTMHRYASSLCVLELVRSQCERRYKTASYTPKLTIFTGTAL
jgi:hypothetical protein